MSEKVPPIREYSIDDESIKNIMNELTSEDNEGVRAYLARISELIENIESKKINRLLNYLLYGMILNDGLAIECIAPAEAVLSAYMDEYISALDRVEVLIAETDELQASTLPELVDLMRMDNLFDKDHRAVLKVLDSELPDIKGNLENIARLILDPDHPLYRR